MIDESVDAMGEVDTKWTQSGPKKISDRDVVASPDHFFFGVAFFGFRVGGRPTRLPYVPGPFGMCSLLVQPDVSDAPAPWRTQAYSGILLVDLHPDIIRLLTGGLLVRVQPQEPIFSTTYSFAFVQASPAVGDFVGAAISGRSCRSSL